jgi:hypothetical protein
MYQPQTLYDVANFLLTNDWGVIGWSSSRGFYFMSNQDYEIAINNMVKAAKHEKMVRDTKAVLGEGGLGYRLNPAELGRLSAPATAN